jgi:hypothetical protein
MAGGEYISVADVARRVGGGCRPRDVSDAFHQRYLDDSRCLKIAGWRAVPVAYVPTIRKVLRRLGWLGRQAAVK